MRLFRTIAVTFSLYSRIPMPRFEWDDADMRFSMACFPMVGAVIGMVFACVYHAAARLGAPDTAACLIMTLVPVLLTGGFHIDGFMDVSDALSSYGSREDKLRILKDPHIGAFAVIRLCAAGLIYIASLITVLTAPDAAGTVYTLAAGFVLARGLSAIAVLNLRSAKNEGMLYYEASCAGQGRKANNVLCAIWIVAAAALMVYISFAAGACEIIAAGACFVWYKYKSYREFGGITGDTAGWFVTLCEVAMTAAAAVSVLAANAANL